MSLNDLNIKDSITTGVVLVLAIIALRILAIVFIGIAFYDFLVANEIMSAAVSHNTWFNFLGLTYLMIWAAGLTRKS